MEVTACFHTGHFPLLMPLTCSPSGWRDEGPQPVHRGITGEMCRHCQTSTPVETQQIRGSGRVEGEARRSGAHVNVRSPARGGGLGDVCPIQSGIKAPFRLLAATEMCGNHVMCLGKGSGRASQCEHSPASEVLHQAFAHASIKKGSQM